MKIMVSACLLGSCCKYNGGNNDCPELKEMLAEHELLPFCPEQMGGLPTPRVPSEIVGNRVLNAEGENVTTQFHIGALSAVAMAKEIKPDLIITQPRSPSCGAKQIYDGSFSKRLIPGQGIAVALLREYGFTVMDAEDFLEAGRKYRK